MFPTQAESVTRKSVLVVDDDPKVRKLLRARLRNEYTIYEAPNGASALEMLGKLHVNAVICDVMMPGMSGLTLVERVRANRNYVPFISLSASGQASDIIRGINAGARQYLTKPVQIEELRAWLKKVAI
jgi:DNA-binding response OmpR family regulator